MEHVTLSCLPDGRYVIHTLDEQYYVFGPFDEQGLARLALIEAGPDKQRTGFHWQGERLHKIVSTGNYQLDLHYQADGPLRLQRIELVRGGTPRTLVSYDYDDQHQLCRVTQSDGTVRRHFRYQDGVMVSHGNALG